jgi:glycosyltransferase involved in cell wall biosynthesis
MIAELITIVIPCKNEEKYIGKTLESISKQKYIEGINIIIADAESTDNTKEIIKTYHNTLNITIINGGSVSFGRNKGSEIVKTPFVLFLDADVELVEDDILLIATLYLKKYDLITCNIKSSINNSKTIFIFKLFNFIRKYFLYKPFSTGSFFLTNLKKFNELGCFDELLTNSEDYILSRKYEKNKFIILDRYITQDDRRFKKMGYYNFIKLIIINFINKNNINHFKKNVNYWK